VSCPVGSSWDYVYDDTYFECVLGNSFPTDSADSNGNTYSCGQGDNCNGVACDVLFSDLYVNATLPNFLDTCVNSTLPITTYPTHAPAESPFEFSARFVASWGRLFEPLGSVSTCMDGNPAVVVSCENGATITFVNSTENSMNCTNLSAYELKCLGDGSSINNLFTSVYYVSITCLARYASCTVIIFQYLNHQSNL
jgi:hypothetical protein